MVYLFDLFLLLEISIARCKYTLSGNFNMSLWFGEKTKFTLFFIVILVLFLSIAWCVLLLLFLVWKSFFRDIRDRLEIGLRWLFLVKLAVVLDTEWKLVSIVLNEFFKLDSFWEYLKRIGVGITRPLKSIWHFCILQDDNILFRPKTLNV